MASILIRNPRRLNGFGDDCGNGANVPCGTVIDESQVAQWPTGNVCGPGTIPYMIQGRVVCLPAVASTGYPELPYVDINGWRMASVAGQTVMGPNSYSCGPGTGPSVLGPNVGCTPGGVQLGIAGDGRVVLKGATDDQQQVFYPQTSSGTLVVDASVPSTQSGTPVATPVTVDIADIANAAQGSMDVAQNAIDQITDMANSPEAAAVAAAIQNQVSRNPLPFIASIAGGWYKGFWGAMIAGAATYYLTRPKVQVAVDSTGASLIVDEKTAADAQLIASSSGAPVNIAGYW